MRIAHVITGLDTGGAEMMLKKIISETAGTFDHVVISLRTTGPIGRSLLALGIPVTALNGAPGRFSLSLLLRLSKELRAAKPDIVQGWMYHANLATWAARGLLLANWPLYWSVRCSIGEPDAIKLTTRITRNICALVSRPVRSIIYNSHVARRQHEKIGYPASKGVVIPNGFDTERFRPSESAREAFRRRYSIPNTQSIVGHIARAQAMKDQPGLLLAALRVVRDAPNTMFVLAGRGVPRLADLHKESAATVKALGDRLILLPEQENTEELMAAFDIFVLSSAFGEGFPNVIGEALSSGTPCVSTNVGDCALIIGKGGIVVPPRDPEKLAAAILELLSLPENERRQMGLAARDKIQEQYSVTKIAEAYSASWKQGALCVE